MSHAGLAGLFVGSIDGLPVGFGVGQRLEEVLDLV